MFLFPKVSPLAHVISFDQYNLEIGIMLCPAKMENRIPNSVHRKQSSRQMSMSDTESQMETTFHSPEQSPFRDPFLESLPPPPPHSKASITVSAVDKFYSPHPSPAAKPSSTGNDSTLPSGGYPLISTAPLALRLAQALFCVISFSLMAADQTQGWTGDSWHRYKEYRYCLAVNVMGFVYSGFQGFNISYRLATNSSTYSALSYHLDFVMDQHGRTSWSEAAAAEDTPIPQPNHSRQKTKIFKAPAQEDKCTIRPCQTLNAQD
ncbi:unnamed protein product [Cuscuta epithymum]|uniref:CASP-like protein n=1 Tax=Cuscuta epithymum TaxID=186058 RepID=A0AAV0D1W0_9ASTE|nr:unnamed protein product [Cuscuta epithymum]